MTTEIQTCPFDPKANHSPYDYVHHPIPNCRHLTHPDNPTVYVALAIYDEEDVPTDNWKIISIFENKDAAYEAAQRVYSKGNCEAVRVLEQQVL
jgi:hypothetical protein